MKAGEGGVLTVVAHCHFNRNRDGNSWVFQLDFSLCRIRTLIYAFWICILGIFSIFLQAVYGLLSSRSAVY